MKFINKLTYWYFSKDALPYWCILVLDCLILLFFYFFGYYCILGGNGVVDLFWQKLFTLIGCMPFYVISFKLFHTYSNIIRYSSFIDLYHVVLANFTGSACVLLVRVLFEDNSNIFPGLRVTLLAFCFGTLMMCIWRTLIKLLFDISNINSNAIYIYIYGIKTGGVVLAKSIRNHKPTKYIIKGFITSDKEIQHPYLMGVPVFPNDTELVPRMLQNNVKGFMVSPLMTEEFRKNEKLINELIEADINIYIMPEAQEWDGISKIDHNQILHKIEIEDLLPRDEIQIDMEAIEKVLKGKSILITGSAGSIGSEIARQVAKFSPEKMLLIDQAETPQHDMRLYMKKNHPHIKTDIVVTSICNQSRMDTLFKSYKPDYVFHAAAYKHVPMMEDNPCEAVQNNVKGTEIIADLSVKYGVKKFVMISTDKAVNPTNVMGCSKRICEIYVQSLDKAIKNKEKNGITQFVTTRFGNVLGSNGSVIPLFREQIKNGGPLTVTHPDIFRYFMLIPEACKLVLEAGTKGKGGEIFVFDMGAPVKIADLARRMIKLSGAKNIEIKYTGLRDGEKLYEEVLNDQEITKPTFNKKIKIATVREYNLDEVKIHIDKLIADSYKYDDMETVANMKKIVPEYKSNHSIYEILDKNES